MLSIARVEIPAPIQAHLKRAAEYSDNVNDYAREDLVGFNRPIAAAFALIVPLALAVVYQGAGPMATIHSALMFVLVVGAGLVIIGKQEWPGIVAKFQSCASAKKKAIADLRCGFGESSFLSNGRCPRFVEHEHGVLALVDAGDLKTLFFDISNDGTDERWALYKAGDLNRRVWRWLRLPVSREVVKFSTEGSKLASHGDAWVIKSVEAWETINVALGEPMDGSVIHQSFDEIADMVERMV